MTSLTMNFVDFLPAAAKFTCLKLTYPLAVSIDLLVIHFPDTIDSNATGNIHKSTKQVAIVLYTD